MHKLYCMHVSEKEQFKTRTNIVISFPLSPFLCSPPHNSSLSLSFSLFYISLLLSSHRFFTYVSTSLTIKPIYIVMLHIFLNIENKQYVFQFNFQTCFQQYFSILRTETYIVYVFLLRIIYQEEFYVHRFISSFKCTKYVCLYPSFAIFLKKGKGRLLIIQRKKRTYSILSFS